MRLRAFIQKLQEIEAKEGDALILVRWGGRILEVTKVEAHHDIGDTQTTIWIYGEKG